MKNILIHYNKIGLSGSQISSILTVFIKKEGVSDEVDEVVGEILSCISGYTSPGGIIELKEYNT